MNRLARLVSTKKKEIKRLENNLLVKNCKHFENKYGVLPNQVIQEYEDFILDHSYFLAGGKLANQSTDFNVLIGHYDICMPTVRVKEAYKVTGKTSPFVIPDVILAETG